MDGSLVPVYNAKARRGKRRRYMYKLNLREATGGIYRDIELSQVCAIYIFSFEVVA